MKKNNVCYSCLIDRRSLSFNKQSCKIENIRITPIKLSVDLKFYDGTIIDGIVIFDCHITIIILIIVFFIIINTLLIILI